MDNTAALIAVDEMANNKAISMAYAALTKKYNMDFEALYIGDRLGCSTARLYMRSVKYPEAVFTALVDVSGDVKDDYIARLACCQVEQFFVNGMEKHGAICAARAAVFSEPTQLDDDITITAAEYVKRYGAEKYFITAAFRCDTADAPAVLRALAETERECGCRIVLSGYLLANREYKKCAEYMKTVPSMSSTVIEKLSPVSHFGVVIDGGRSSVTVNELELQMRGGR